jgi:hypothetical protein
MSFLPESVTTDLERLILSVRPSETSKLVSIVSKHLTQVVSIAFPNTSPAPATTTKQKTNNNSAPNLHAADNNNKHNNNNDSGADKSNNEEMTTKSSSADGDHNSTTPESPKPIGTTTLTSTNNHIPAGPTTAPATYDPRARSAVELLCAVATCESLETGALDVARAVLKLMHRDNIHRLRGKGTTNLTLVRFCRILLECYTDDYEAVTTAIDDSLMENESVGLWLDMIGKHPLFGDLIIQLWGKALGPATAVTISSTLFVIPWIKQQAHQKLIDLLPTAIRSEEYLPLFGFFQEIFSRGLNCHVGHFVDHLLLGNCGEEFVDAVIGAAEEVADGSTELGSPCLPEAIALLSVMLSMLQRSSLSQNSFDGDYHRTLKTNTAVQCFISRLPRLCNLLNCDALAFRSGSFGSSRLRLIDACMTLFRFNRFDSDTALMDVKFIEQLFSLAESYPNHDVVLAALAEICTEAITRSSNDGGRLERYLSEHCKLQQKLIPWVREDKWASTSLRALALTVGFGLAQKTVKNGGDDDSDNEDGKDITSDRAVDDDDDTTSDADSQGSGQKINSASSSDNDNNKSDDDDVLASPAFKEARKNERKQKKAALLAEKNGDKKKKSADETSGGLAALSKKKSAIATTSSVVPPALLSSPEWKEFISGDLPTIWKEWFSEITGFRFQEPKSGGGKQVIHRPLVNLAKTGKSMMSPNQQYSNLSSSANSNNNNSSNNNSNNTSSTSTPSHHHVDPNAASGDNNNSKDSVDDIIDTDSVGSDKIERLFNERHNEAAKRRAAAAAARRAARITSAIQQHSLRNTVTGAENGGHIISSPTDEELRFKGNEIDDDFKIPNDDDDEDDVDKNNKNKNKNLDEFDTELTDISPSSSGNGVRARTTGNNNYATKNGFDNETTEQLETPVVAPVPKPKVIRRHARSHSGEVTDMNELNNMIDFKSLSQQHEGHHHDQQEQYYLQQQQQQKSYGTNNNNKSHVDPSTTTQAVDDDNNHHDEQHQEPARFEEDNHHHTTTSTGESEEWVERFITEEVENQHQHQKSSLSQDHHQEEQREVSADDFADHPPAPTKEYSSEPTTATVEDSSSPSKQQQVSTNEPYVSTGTGGSLKRTAEDEDDDNW